MFRGYKIIGLCLARIQEPASYEIISELNKRIKGTEYRLFVYNSCADLSLPESEKSGQAKVYNMIDYDVVDVLLVYEDRVRNDVVNERIINTALDHEVPVVIIGQKRVPGCITMDYDHQVGIEKVIRHVIDDCGKTKLHFMSGTIDSPYSHIRNESFKKVLAEKNMPFDDSMISYGEFWAGPARREIQRIYDSGDMPEAIICANDNMGIAVCGFLTAHGIRVPEDVVVTGYDGILEADLCEPRLTTAKCSQRILADEIFKLVEKIQAGTASEGLVLIEPETLLRESTGCTGESQGAVADYVSELNGHLFRFQTENVDLTGISSKIQQCENVDEIGRTLQHSIFYDMCVVVDSRFFREESMANLQMDEGEKELLLLGNSDVLEGFKPYVIEDGTIVPQIDYLLENHRYVIFNALSYMDWDLGYSCFFFSEDLAGSFFKIPQSVTFLGYALGGYINVRHEHYLKDKIDKMYRVDPLTGLYNRRGFAIEYQKLLDQRTAETKLTVLLADVDKLKKVNDIYGHAAGDVAISTTADALRYASPEGTICTRFGGDEMLAVCLGEHDTATIRKRFYEYLDRANGEVQRPYDVSASIGIYVTDAEDNLEFEELITKSDKLMYMEKEKRRSLLNKDMLS